MASRNADDSALRVVIAETRCRVAVAPGGSDGAAGPSSPRRPPSSTAWISSRTRSVRADTRLVAGSWWVGVSHPPEGCCGTGGCVSVRGSASCSGTDCRTASVMVPRCTVSTSSEVAGKYRSNRPSDRVCGILPHPAVFSMVRVRFRSCENVTVASPWSPLNSLLAVLVRSAVSFVVELPSPTPAGPGLRWICALGSTENTPCNCPVSVVVVSSRSTSSRVAVDCSPSSHRSERPTGLPSPWVPRNVRVMSVRPNGPAKWYVVRMPPPTMSEYSASRPLGASAGKNRARTAESTRPALGSMSQSCRKDAASAAFRYSDWTKFCRACSGTCSGRSASSASSMRPTRLRVTSGRTLIQPSPNAA
ncbi:hypothetical protein GCM10025787_02620 [Saccharopolyspora rosea]